MEADNEGLSVLGSCGRGDERLDARAGRFDALWRDTARVLGRWRARCFCFVACYGCIM